MLKEEKGFTTFRCNVCSKEYSFLNNSQYETIKKIKAFGIFTCDSCLEHKTKKDNE